MSGRRCDYPARASVFLFHRSVVARCPAGIAGKTLSLTTQVPELNSPTPTVRRSPNSRRRRFRGRSSRVDLA